MCAAKSGTPSLIIAGGRDHRANDVRRGHRDGKAHDPDDERSVDRREQQRAPAYSMMIELNLRPRPVSVTTPTMMPAPAQVVATLSTRSSPPRAP